MSALADPGDTPPIASLPDLDDIHPTEWLADPTDVGAAYNLGYAHGMADGLRRGRDAERDAIAQRLADGVAQRAGVVAKDLPSIEPTEPVRYPRQVRGGTYRSWAEVKAAREAMEAAREQS